MSWREIGLHEIGLHEIGLHEIGLHEIARPVPLIAFDLGGWRLHLIWADGGYSGKLIGWVGSFGGWVLEIVKRSDTQKDLRGFVLLPVAG